MASTLFPNLTFSQTKVRSSGAHSNASSQQPANSGGGGGGGGGGGIIVATAATLALMKALSPSGWLDGQFVELSGYQARDDGGGGMFEWVSASTLADDGGCIIEVTGFTTGRLIRVVAGIRCTTTQTNCPSLNVWWYGAIPGNTPGDCTPGINRALAAIAAAVTYTNGTIYFPTGWYACVTPISVTSAQAVTLKGDGAGSVLANYVASQQTAFITLNLTNGGGMQDMGITTLGSPGVDHLSVLWLNTCAEILLTNVIINANSSGGISGGILRITTGTQLRVSDVFAYGNGTALYLEGASGTMADSWFISGATPGTSPSMHWKGSDSMQISNCFFQGGGPWCSFTGCALTGATGVVVATGSSFTTGDWVLVRGATNAGYNGRWQITVSGTSVTLVGASNLGNDTVTISSLWSCVYVSGINNVSESFMQDCTCNTGGIPSWPGVSAGNMPGTVGVFLDGFSGTLRNIGQIAFRNIFCDYGYTAFYLHGITDVALQASVSAITMESCRPNGGPRDNFGCIRMEGTINVSISNSLMFPIVGGPTLGAGQTFYSYVISDGGQAYPTEDIVITGGMASNQSSAYLISACTAQISFVFQGANVKRVSIANVDVDATSAFATVAALQSTGTGAAVLTNGITILYPNGAGRLNLIDSSRGIGGASL